MQNPIIPRPLKRFKGKIFREFTWYDFGVLSFIAIFVILTWTLFTMSWFAKGTITLIAFSVSLFLVLPINDIKGYIRLYRSAKFYISKKKYLNKEVDLLNPYKEIEEINGVGYIKLNTGSYILPIELTGYNISILQEKEQYSRIRNFQDFLKVNQNTFSLIKCTLPNDLSEQKRLLINLFEKYKKEKNKPLSNATEQNLDVLFNLEKKELNFTDKYFVLIFGSKQSIDTNKNRLINYLRNSYLFPKQSIPEISQQIINSFYGLNPSEDFTKIKKITFKKNHIVISKEIQEDDHTVTKPTFTRIMALNSLPQYASLGWLNNINQDDNSWSLTFTGYDKQKATKKIDKVIKKLEEEHMGAKNSSSETKGAVYLRGLYELNERLHANGEIIHSTYSFIKVSGTTLKELDQKTDDLIQELRSTQIDVDKLTNLQKEGFESILPKPTLSTKNLVSIELPTEVSALGFPFYAESLRDPEGIYLGYTNSNSNVYFDPFNLGDYRKNANAFVLGTSGAGKTTTVMKLLKDQRVKGTKVFVIDPEREYKQLCKKMGGDWVNFGSDKKFGDVEQTINPLQFFKDESDGRSLLSSHLQFLEQFFRTLFPELTLKETNILKDVLLSLYKKKKITEASSSSKIIEKQFPTLNELYKAIATSVKSASSSNLEAFSNLKIYFSCFASKESPESQLWDGHTNFKAQSSEFMVLDTHSLGESGNKRISNAQLFLLLKFLNNIMVQNKIMKEAKSKEHKKLMIVIDEAHLLIDERQPFGLDFMYQMVKRARKYDTMTLISTQNVADFCGGSPETQKKTTAIINTSQYSFLLGMNPGDIEALDKVYSSIGGLTPLEKDTLSTATKGVGILGIGPKERKIISVDLSDDELNLLEH